jgi:hypothetical protein
MLSLPVYLRGTTYYFHTRFRGKQFKRSLNTSDRRTAIIRALDWIRAIRMADNEIDLSKIRKFEIDLSQGIAKADGPDDHAHMMEALAMMKSLQAGVAPVQMPNPALSRLHQPTSALLPSIRMFLACGFPIWSTSSLT